MLRSAPVWVVKFEDACVPIYGPPGSEDAGTCSVGDVNVVIEATDGRFVAAYTDN